MPRESGTHARHDPLLVVALAAGDLTGTERDRATSLIAECTECARLHDDVLAVARATAALPAARRSRDFRLSPGDAARLRPAGWRRLVAAFAGPRLAFTRQLGVGLTTIGLAGLLLTVLPGISLPMGSAGAAPSAAAAQEYYQSDRSLAAPSVLDILGEGSAAGPTSAPVAAQPSPAASVMAANGGDTSGRTALTAPTATDANAPASEPSLLLVGSVAAIGIGLALLLARRLGRRLSGS